MPTPTPPPLLLHPLRRADGSAHYSSHGYTILVGVNGPVEVQRRDELPEECYVEVNVRPHNAVGQVKERHLEKVVGEALRSVLLTKMFPRQMVQVTLQVMSVPADENLAGRAGGQGESYLPILPALLNASCLALMDAAIPMRCTLMSTILAVGRNSDLMQDPGAADIKAAGSIHVLAFTSEGHLLVAESEGRFSARQWEAVEQGAERICMGGGTLEDVQMMDNDDGNDQKGLQDLLRVIVTAKVAHDERWRGR